MTEMLTAEEIAELHLKWRPSDVNYDRIVATVETLQAQNGELLNTINQIYSEIGHNSDSAPDKSALISRIDHALSNSSELYKKWLKENDELEQENDNLQAQNKALVEALESMPCADPDGFCGCTYAHRKYMAEGCEIRKKALSLLPAEALERERKREAVVRAAIEWNNTNGALQVPAKETALSEAIEELEELEALEGGK